MAHVKVFYEAEAELLTIYWQAPRTNQLCTEVGDGIIVIKDETTGQPIGMELLAYRPGDARFDAVSVEVAGVATT